MRVLLLIFLIELLVVTGLSVFVRETLSVAAGGFGVSLIGALLGLRYLTEARQLKPITALAVVSSAAAIAMLGTANLPLRVAFECYRGRFETLAQAVRAGERVDFPRRIGPFVIRGGGLHSHGAAPYFLTGGSARQIEGFVQEPDGRSCRLWSLSRLGRDWSYVAER